MKITNVEFFHLNPRLCDRYQGHEVRFAGIDTQTVFRVTLDNGVVGYGDERGHALLGRRADRSHDRPIAVQLRRRCAQHRPDGGAVRRHGQGH